MKFVIGISREYHWLFNKSGHEFKREDLSGNFREPYITNELPTFGEIGFFPLLVSLLI
jgi:hypothetical protein